MGRVTIPRAPRLWPLAIGLLGCATTGGTGGVSLPDLPRSDIAIVRTIHLAGHALNQHSQNTAGAFIDVDALQDGRYRAIGIYDGQRLFGRFAMLGQARPCGAAAELCLTFQGQLRFGEDRSHFPSRTTAGFKVTLDVAADGAVAGTYQVGPMPVHGLTPQPALMALSVVEQSQLVAGALGGGLGTSEAARRHWVTALVAGLRGEDGAAAAALEQFVLLEPNDPGGHGQLSWSSLRDRQLRRAREAAERAIALAPTEYLWHLLLGHARLLGGEHEAAHAHYETAYRLVTTNQAYDDGPLGDLAWFVEVGWQPEAAARELAWFVAARAESPADANDRATLLILQGKDEEAAPPLREALRRIARNLGPKHLLTAQAQLRLGEVLGRLGRLSESLELIRAGQAVIAEVLGPDAKEQIQPLASMAWALESFGRHAEAEALFSRAYQISAKANGPGSVDALDLRGSWAFSLARLGKVGEARAAYAELLEALVARIGPEHPINVGHFNNLAILHHGVGDEGAAIQAYRRALVVAKKHLAADHPSQAIIAANLANILRTQGNTDEAFALLSESLANPWLPPANRWWMLQEMSRALLAKEAPERAIFFAKQAVNIVQGLRGDIRGAPGGLQSSFLASHEHVYAYLASLLVEAGRLPEAQQVFGMLKEREYFEYLRRSAGPDRAAGLPLALTAAETSWAERYQALSEDSVTVGREYAELRERGREGALGEVDAARAEALRVRLAESQRAFEEFFGQVKTELSLPSARRAELLRLERPRKFQHALAEMGHGAVALHYLSSADRLHIILTTPQTQVARTVEISEAKLNELVFKFRGALQTEGTYRHAAGKALWDLLIRPIAQDLEKARAETLMLSLGGTLRYVPFAALSDGRTFLVERHALAIYTAAAQTDIKDKPRAAWRVAALGLSRQVEGFEPLPSVPGELEGIVRRDEPSDPDGVLPGTVYLDARFDRKALLEALDERFQVLHIASHFVFKPGTEEDSFLLLGTGEAMTIASMRAEDLDFGNVDLLTLSACDTALGGDADGHEIEGFAALAQNQGAKGVLATLWPVADESTGTFMTEVYRRREAGKLTKAEALRQTQVAYIKRLELGTKADAATRAAYEHPFFWAPFVLMGNWL